jgi:hypothetical protein
MLGVQRANGRTNTNRKQELSHSFSHLPGAPWIGSDKCTANISPRLASRLGFEENLSATLTRDLITGINATKWAWTPALREHYPIDHLSSHSHQAQHAPAIRLPL